MVIYLQASLTTVLDIGTASASRSASLPTKLPLLTNSRLGVAQSRFWPFVEREAFARTGTQTSTFL